MAVNIVKKEQIKAKIETLDKDGEVIDTQEEVVDEVTVDKPMANIGVKLGTTKNLGNYESLRVDVNDTYLPFALMSARRRRRLWRRRTRKSSHGWTTSLTKS